MTTPSHHNPVTPIFLLSVVVLVYNEESVLGAMHQRLSRVMGELGMPWEVIYVNDGSSDATLSLIRGLQQGNQK